MSNSIKPELKTYNLSQLEDLLSLLDLLRNNKELNGNLGPFSEFLYALGIIRGDRGARSFNLSNAEGLRQQIYKKFYGYLGAEEKQEVEKLDITDSVWHWLTHELNFLKETSKDCWVIQPEFWGIGEFTFSDIKISDTTVPLITKQKIFKLIKRRHEKGFKDLGVYRLSFDEQVLYVNKCQVRKKFNTGFPLKAIEYLFQRLDQEVTFDDFSRDVCNGEDKFAPSALREKLRCSQIDRFIVIKDNRIILKSALSLSECPLKKGFQDINGKKIHPACNS